MLVVQAASQHQTFPAWVSQLVTMCLSVYVTAATLSVCADCQLRSPSSPHKLSLASINAPMSLWSRLPLIKLPNINARTLLVCSIYSLLDLADTLAGSTQTRGGANTAAPEEEAAAATQAPESSASVPALGAAAGLAAFLVAALV